MPTKKILVFGASGTLGKTCSDELRSSGYESIAISLFLPTSILVDVAKRIEMLESRWQVLGESVL